MTAPNRQLYVLGGFRIVNGTQIMAVPTAAAKLIALLAINDRPMSRSQIAGTVWPMLTEQRASANLRSIMWRLPPEAQPLAPSTGTTIALADDLDVDLRRAGDIVRSVLGPQRLPAGDVARDHVAVAASVTLLCRPLLPEWEDDWLVFERERIRQLHFHALERLAESLLASGDALSAVDVSTAVIAAEPLRESSHLLVIRAHLAAGNRLDARRCYVHYRDLVRHELNVDPAVHWSDLAPPERLVDGIDRTPVAVTTAIGQARRVAVTPP